MKFYEKKKRFGGFGLKVFSYEEGKTLKRI